MKSKSRYKHFKYITHTWFKQHFIGRYIVSKHNFDEIDEFMRKLVNTYNSKY